MQKLLIKMGKFIEENYKYLIVLFLILFLGLYRLPYNLYVGGGIISLNNRLEIEDEKREEGSFNLTYVTSSRATIPTYLLSYLTGWERENINDSKLDENDNVRDIWKREQLYLQEANDNAIISAYKASGIPFSINKEIIKILYIDKNSVTDMEIGDTILSIDGVEIKEFADIRKTLTNFNVGDEIKTKYLRNDKEYDGYFKVIDMNGEKKAGFYIIKLYDYTIPRKVNLKFSSREGGPSGGFMTSLAIYTRLTGNDLTKGDKIVGTGTIDNNGNIGEIGGITYKVTGAYHGKADVFLVPSANYDEAVKFAKEKNYKLNIVKVDTLEEAIKYLESR